MQSLCCCKVWFETPRFLDHKVQSLKSKIVGPASVRPIVETPEICLLVLSAEIQNRDTRG